MLGIFLLLTLAMYIVSVVQGRSIEVLLSPVIVPLPFFLIWLITKGKGLGFGDIILFIGVGLFFSVFKGLAVLVISVWIGALYGLYIKYVALKSKHPVTAIPFVPFIVIAFLLVLFSGIDIVSIVTFFS